MVHIYTTKGDDMKLNTFGPYVKSRRIEKKLTLRKFSKLIDEDPSNWSKVEREKKTPPQNDYKIGLIAKTLNLRKGYLMELATIAAGKIPKKILNDKELMKVLPAFLRTLGNTRLTPDQVRIIINKNQIGKNYYD